jgi:F-type H+-transporting ATPase subunit epsilon
MPNITVQSHRIGNSSYLQYANIAARATRAALTSDLKVVAMRREEQTLKFSNWMDGKQGELVL